MNAGLDPALWHDLFAAYAAASAALLGLLFVAMSLHVGEIQGNPVLRLRARVNLQALAALVVVSLMVLLPSQPAALLGAELVVIVAVYAWLVVVGAIRTSRETHGLPRWAVNRLLRQNTLLLLQLAAAISLMAGRGPGLFLEAPVVLIALPVTIFNTWRVLIVPEGAVKE